MITKPRELERIIKRRGWRCVGQRGSHRYYRHPHLPGKVVIPFHKGKDIGIGLAHRILHDAGVEKE